MRGTTRVLIPAIFIIAAVLILLLRKPGGVQPETDKKTVELSYNLCLRFGHQPEIFQTDTTLRQAYLRKYWIDTTAQYYVKAIIAPPADTLFVTSFNNTSLNRARQLTEDSRIDIFEKAEGKKDDLYYLKSFGKYNTEFIVRYLIPDRRFRVVTMIDQLSRDSAYLYNVFSKDSLTQKLTTCL